MTKLLQIFILLNIVAMQISAQSEPAMVRIDYPEFVETENSFEVSAVFKFNEKPQNSFNLNFRKSNNANINSAYINIGENKNQLRINYSKNDAENFSININAAKIQIEENVPYQIIFICKIFGSNSSYEKFLSYKGNVIKSSNSFSKKNNSGNFISFYKTQETAGNCLVLNKESSFEINFTNDDERVPILFEFWFKTFSKLKNIFKILEANSDDTLFALSRNDLGFASTPFNKNDVIKNDVYISNSTWNYFSIHIKKENNGIKLVAFLNSKLMSTKFISNKSVKTILKFILENQNSDKNFEIERIRLTKFGSNLK